MNHREPRVALVYDRVNSWGGAERVLLQLHQLYPHAPLFTSVYDDHAAPWAKDWDIRASWLQKIPWLRRRHQYVGWLMPIIFESFSFSEFDIVISVSSEAAKGIVTQPHQLHVCYLLTPTRYLWSHQREYLEQIPTLLRKSAQFVMHFLQKWDVMASSRPDYVIPISQRVKIRAEKYYGRFLEEPLYPAISTLPLAKRPPERVKKPYFFAWGRHVSYKKFDQIIRAAVEIKFPLIIAGEGPQTSYLKALTQQIDPAGEYVTFVGMRSDSEITWYLQNAQAAVIPQEEDFGLTIIEAVSQGCPVVVHSKSGASELLRPEEDGICITNNDSYSLQKAMEQVISHPWNNLDIQQQARQYAEVVWQKSFHNKIMGLWQQQQKSMKGMHEQHT